MKQQRLDTPVFEFWYLVGDDLRQHLRELHTEGFIHKGVETDLEKTLDHLQEGAETRQVSQTGLKLFLIYEIIFELVPGSGIYVSKKKSELPLDSRVSTAANGPVSLIKSTQRAELVSMLTLMTIKNIKRHAESFS